MTKTNELRPEMVPDLSGLRLAYTTTSAAFTL